MREITITQDGEVSEVDKTVRYTNRKQKAVDKINDEINGKAADVSVKTEPVSDYRKLTEEFEKELNVGGDESGDDISQSISDIAAKYGFNPDELEKHKVVKPSIDKMKQKLKLRKRLILDLSLMLVYQS